MARVKLEIFIPEESLNDLRIALQKSGAGEVGNYDCTLAYSKVNGSWRALEGAKPYLGNVNEIMTVAELKVETFVDDSNLAETLDNIKQIHPYEEPVIFVLPLLQ